MDITWLGHACFRIQGGSAAILTDPYPPDVGLPGYEPSATIVTVSNSHPNHSYLDGLDLEAAPRVLTRPGEFQISGAHVIGLRTSLNRDDSLVAENIAFLIEMDDVIVCHLGDLAAPPSAGAMGRLSEAHVLLLPAGGGCTLEPSQAIEAHKRHTAKGRHPDALPDTGDTGGGRPSGAFSARDGRGGHIACLKPLADRVVFAARHTGGCPGGGRVASIPPGFLLEGAVESIGSQKAYAV